MEKLLIKGGNPLSGRIECSGAKNAALPMIASTILCEEEVILKNLPYLQDITTMFELLGSMGADIILNENMDFTITSKNLQDIEGTQKIFNHRAEMCSLASQGKWSIELEKK